MSSSARSSEHSGYTYVGGELACDGIALSRIAAAVGTPFYCYSSATLERQYRRFADAFADQLGQAGEGEAERREVGQL